MAKPKPVKVPSDSCAVRVGKELCYPHEGESVELFTDETVGMLRVRVKFARIQAEFDALKGEADLRKRLDAMNAVADEHYQELCSHLAERVVSWDWTDLRGRPLPPPADDDGKPLGLLRLHAQELWWLLNALAPVETEEERKNE